MKQYNIFILLIVNKEMLIGEHVLFEIKVAFVICCKFYSNRCIPRQLLTELAIKRLLLILIDTLLLQQQQLHFSILLAISVNKTAM